MSRLLGLIVATGVMVAHAAHGQQPVEKIEKLAGDWSAVQTMQRHFAEALNDLVAEYNLAQKSLLEERKYWAAYVKGLETKPAPSATSP